MSLTIEDLQAMSPTERFWAEYWARIYCSRCYSHIPLLIKLEAEDQIRSIAMRADMRTIGLDA